MKYIIVVAVLVYWTVAVGVLAVHTQMPVTFGLAVLRSVLWPIWIAGGLHGAPMRMD